MNYFYGGAFNPMTKAHLKIITEIISLLTDNDMLYIAIANHDYKNYNYSYEFRRAIIKKNLETIVGKDLLNKHIRIICQDARTWKFLNAYFKGNFNITLILGEDEYNDLKTLNIWHYSKEILNTFKFKVFSRSEDTKDISATKVRELLKQNVNYEELKKYITKETWLLLNME